MHPGISLQEYREHYPCAASIPTLTQMRLVGPLMARLRKEAERKARRGAFRLQLFAAVVWPFTALRRSASERCPERAAKLEFP